LADTTTTEEHPDIPRAVREADEWQRGTGMMVFCRRSALADTVLKEVPQMPLGRVQGRKSLWCLVLGGALVALPVLLWARHGHWIDQYRNAGGTLCCGEWDCVPVTARLVEDQGPVWLAEVNGTAVELPKGSVHLSLEPIAYWCHSGHPSCRLPQLTISSICGRCLFVAVG
jgi:hypothetical protein